MFQGWNWGAFWGVLLGFLTSLLGLLGGGCTPNDFVPKAFPQELGQAVNTFALSMADQTVWKEVLADIDGNVQNPGVAFFVRGEIVTGVRLEGVTGDVDIGGTGHGTGVLTDDARKVILEQYQSATTQAQRDYWLKLLGLVETETEPPSAGPAPPG